MNPQHPEANSVSNNGQNLNPQYPPASQPPAFQSTPQAPQNPAPAPQFATATASEPYVSNPFLATVQGFIQILKNNPVSSMLLSFFAFLGYLGFYILLVVLTSLAGEIGGSIAILLGLVIAIIFVGAISVIAAKSVQSARITTGGALGTATSKIFPLLGLTIISGLLIGIGFLLFVIPGLILAARFSLSGIAMFDENLGPIKALKRSLELTKGHTIEMFGALIASTLVGASSGLLLTASITAPLVNRYYGLKSLKASGASRPAVHWLNYLMTIPIVLGALMIIITMIVAISGGVDKAADEANSQDNSTTTQIESETPPADSTSEFYFDTSQ